jgi:hypothetical protein
LETSARGPIRNPPGSAESHFAALFELYQDLIDRRDGGASDPAGAARSDATAGRALADYAT